MRNFDYLNMRQNDASIRADLWQIGI